MSSIGEIAKFRTSVQVNTINEFTSASGVTVDGMLIKDGKTSSNNVDWQEPTTFRNRVQNAAMAIDQRNAGANQTFTAAAALAYSVDRFYGYCTGANVVGARVAGTLSPYMYQFTGAASVTKIGFAQRIEAQNCWDLANTTATLAVDLSNSLLTTVTWTMWYANTADTFGTLASPTRTQIATGTFTVTSTNTRYTTSVAIPTAATTGIEVEFSVGAQTSGTFKIGRVQLEPGTIATPFEFRPYGTELALCQRYLPVATFTGYSYQGQAYGATGARVWIPFTVPARVAPTGCSATTGLTASQSNLATAGGTAAFSSATVNGCSLDITGASGMVAGSASAIQGNATVYFNGCEL